MDNIAVAEATITQIISNPAEPVLTEIDALRTTARPSDLRPAQRTLEDPVMFFLRTGDNPPGAMLARLYFAT